jgi:PAS domain S-box-containing protein
VQDGDDTKTQDPQVRGRDGGSDARALEIALSEVEERFSSFIESSVESVFCYELPHGVPADHPPADIAEAFMDARLVVCNGMYARTRGSAEPRQLYGRLMPDLARESLSRIKELIVILIKQGNLIDGMEVSQQMPDGKVRYALAKAQLVVRDGRVRRLWGILRDITAQKESERQRQILEDRLAQSQKMESIGLLAGGIAHDFNNLLLVIGAGARMAIEDMRRDPAAADQHLGQVVAAAQRATELTQGLLAFSKGHAVKREPLRLEKAVEDLTSLLRRLIPERISLQYQPAQDQGQHGSDDLVIEADRSQLDQLLLNVCLNARDAIADVGVIVIATQKRELSEGDVRGISWMQPGTYVEITIADSGCGIPAELRDRVFEPFFTTKDPGTGTGLGLAIAYTIVKKHGGLIRAEARTHGIHEVSGTNIRIWLPLSNRLPRPEVRGEVASTARRGGGETVLVAEDHEMVAALVKTLLERAGYCVLHAPDGEVALSLFERHENAIDLVILDAVMPRVSGEAVYRAIADRRPDIPILVASGYTRGTFSSEILAARDIDFIPKPFDSALLLRKVREALERKAAGDDGRRKP